MTNIHLISFASERYENSIKRLHNQAINTNWFKTITMYSDKDIDYIFKKKHSDIFKNKRGYGYWIWKNYFIKKKLNEIQYDDILIYIDAGFTININGKDRFFEYIELINNSDYNILSFQLNENENVWTINEIFNLFNISDKDEIYSSKQLVGGLRFFKKTENSINLLNTLTEIIYNNSLLITDKYNSKQNNNFFKDNRHDQSISSVFYKKHNATIILKDETYCLKKNNPFFASRICDYK